MVEAKNGPMGVLTNNIAEVTTLDAGLEWCVEKGVQKVIIEEADLLGVRSRRNHEIVSQLAILGSMEDS
ncbi:hypothetical protein SUGI_0419560 [Cryptomeria japonica]|nr:hypothetical protein SUGI_0419560 [Cryptomeria japonica]